MSCKLENVVADGVVCGDAVFINGAVYGTDWREVKVESLYCECGEYFNEDALIEHLNLKEA